MATSTSPQPSFSPRRKWRIVFSVAMATTAVFLILAGVNYLSSQYFFKRFYLSTNTRVRLSPRTLSVLKGLTNRVDVTVFYDQDNPIYADIISLLNEYQAHTRKLSVKTIDYYRDPGAAEELKAKYKEHIGSATNKDFIIFDNGGRVDFVNGNWLATYRYELEQSTNDDSMNLKHKLVSFNGEMLFTAKLFALTQAKPLKAYFLQGHGERSPNEKKELDGYGKLADIFQRNYVETPTLNGLFGTNTVPLDCNLLVIAGPQGEFQDVELEKISQYLDQGGRLFVLFDNRSVDHNIGLEAVLAKWGVRVAHGTVRDLELETDPHNTSFAITNFAPHEITRPLIGNYVQIVLPRPIARIRASSQSADEPQVTEIAFSSPHSKLDENPSTHSYPLMVAVEKGAPKGVVTERGTTRMLVVGDSLFLDNEMIGALMNEDFADSAVNWLLERTTFLEGVGPRKVAEYQIVMDRGQMRAVNGLLLAAIPGGILLFGGLVWLRRRK